MSKKQLVILVAVLVVLGALLLLTRKSDQASWSAKSATPSGSEKILADSDINKVSKIVISSGKDSAELARKDGSWKIPAKSDYAADFDKISSFLKKFFDMKIVQAIQVDSSKLARFELDPESSGKGGATKIEFFDDTGKKTASFLLGKKHFSKDENSPYLQYMPDSGFPDGRYIMDEGKKGKVLVVGETMDDASADPVSWLDKAFCELDKVKSIEKSGAKAEENWKVGKKAEADSFVIDGAKEGESLDPSKVSSLGSLFKYISLKDVKPLTPEFKPETTVKLDTFDGFKYTVAIAPKEGDSDAFWVNVKTECAIPSKREPGKDEKPEDKEKLDKEFKEKNDKLAEKLKKEQALDKWLVLLSKRDVEALLKARKDLLTEKKEDAKPETGNTLETSPLNKAPAAKTAPAALPPGLPPPPDKLPGLAEELKKMEAKGVAPTPKSADGKTPAPQKMQLKLNPPETSPLGPPGKSSVTPPMPVKPGDKISGAPVPATPADIKGIKPPMPADPSTLRNAPLPPVPAPASAASKDGAPVPVKPADAKAADAPEPAK
jgi:hypothetical protein